MPEGHTSPAMYESFVFNGETYGRIANQGILLSEPINMPIAADSSFFIRSGMIVDSYSHNLMTQANQEWANTSLGDFDAMSNNFTSQVRATGAMSASNTTAETGTLPYLLLGVPAAPMPAVAIIGDSIGDGAHETATDSNGNLGFCCRGLSGVNGHQIPWLKLTVSSGRLQYMTLDNSPRQRNALQYVTHVIIQSGGNDVAAGTSLATIQTYLTNLCNDLKKINSPYGKRLQIAVVTTGPRTTSTDNWQTAANQTVQANYGTGSVRDTLNSWLATQAGTLFDSLIDINPYVEDQANHGKWVTNGTANYATVDGIHETTAGYILAAQAVNAWALGIAP